MCLTYFECFCNKLQRRMEYHAQFIFLFFQKQVYAGLANGSVKG
jgi:hypothetical protein